MLPFKNLPHPAVFARILAPTETIQHRPEELAKLNYHQILGQLGCSMVKLADLGFRKGVVSETIVSTYDKDGLPNAAPMGAALQDEQHLEINLYNSSTTLANIKTTRYAIVNLTDKIDVYYKTAFKEANPDGKLPKEWFAKAPLINAPKLLFADAIVEVSLVDLTMQGVEKMRAVFGVESVQAKKGFPQVYYRAFGLTLEAIVHATRVKILAGDPKEREHVENLLRKIRDCNGLIGRIAPSSSYSMVMADMIKRMDARIKK
jgi:hypothetical protein